MLRTVTTAVVVSGLLTTSAVLVLTVDARQDRAEEACERREAIVAGFNAFTDALVAVEPDEPRTPEQEARFAERTAAFRADLAQRLEPLGPDCS